MKKYYFYILTNNSNTVLYCGVTNNIERRITEHRLGEVSSFTKKYNVHKLVYLEEYSDIREAIAREKQIKGGSRKQKMNLIININPSYNDLLLN